MPPLPLEEAQRRLFARAQRTPGEEVALADAAGRALVERLVHAPFDVPGFANSAMDGYAVSAADTPGTLRVVGEVAAGMASLPAVAPGTTVRIMTGAPLPPGADAVVPVEAASPETDGSVTLAQAGIGAHVRAAGHDTRAGDEVCVQGVLTPAKVALLASLGLGRVVVHRRPRVAIMSTGDELVGPGEPLGPHQIHDANSVALAAAVREVGGEPILLPHARDDAAEIERALLRAAEMADLVVTSAGVSVGRHDHVRAILESRGALDFWRIAIQPGKPLAVGEIGGRLLIGLPGNPVSALVVFELVVRPFLRAMQGLAGDGRMRLRATVEERIGKDAARRAFLRVVVRDAGGRLVARAAGGQQSSQLRPLADANALLVVPEGAEAAEPGQSYEAILLEPIAEGRGA
ncbi:MAG TPA: gephyrin-like molybdotransferase Glp [Candidatus Limnocylindria bacterium]|nr:gephyrin-like molybdotransferase Glp [Candidatus Limnocylindria bacterium]